MMDKTTGDQKPQQPGIMMQRWNQVCSSQAFEYVKSLLEALESENFSLQL